MLPVGTRVRIKDGSRLARSREALWCLEQMKGKTLTIEMDLGEGNYTVKEFGFIVNERYLEVAE